MKSIKLVNKYKKISWECTTTCNYSCTYCPPENSDGKYRWPDSTQTENVIKFARNFFQDVDIANTDFDIMGGEPTLWPGFADFYKEISKFCLVGLSTNASRTTRYWEKLEVINPFRYFIMSFHPETADVDHFLKVAEIMQEKTPHVDVHILYYPHYKEKCMQMYNAIKNSDLQVSAKLKPLFSTDIFFPNYTSDDEEIIKQTPRILSKNLQSFLSNGQANNPIINVDGEQYGNLNWMITNKRNNFKGWLCEYGKNVLYITPDGNLRGSACGVNRKKPFANVYNDVTYNIPKPVVCPYSECSCLGDVELITKKNIFNKPEVKSYDRH